MCSTEAWTGECFSPRTRTSWRSSGSLRKRCELAGCGCALTAFDAQPLAFCRLARAGWRSTRVHAASDQHAYETVEGASSRDRLRLSLSRALQVFPGGKRRPRLPGHSLRGAERPACKPRGARGIVALVEFAPCGARRPGVSHPLDVAFATPHRLAATCQPAANGSRSGGVAVLRQSRSALRRSQLGHRHGRAIGAGMDDSASWKTEDRRNNHKACHRYLYSLVAVTFHLCGGCHLSPVVAVTFHLCHLSPPV